MSFVETDAQVALQEAVAEVVDKVVVPVATAVPEGGKLSADDLRRVYKALTPLGYLGSTISKDFGGAGMSYVDYGLLLEALARGPVVLGEVVPPRTINYLGDTEQKGRWLPKLFSGDWISTAAITEPQAGSDMRGFKTTAVLQGDGYVVNGQKRWIKLGGVSDLMTLMVVDAQGGLSRLVLERAVSPWESREHDAVGIKNVSFAELTFKDVRVPRANLLGDAGAGGEQFHRGIESSRVFVGIQAVGLARHALDIATRYAKERVAFGRPIGKFQGIQMALADAATRLQAARLLCLNALSILDAGRRAPSDVSMAKLFAVETAIRTCQVAMESMGAFGLSVEAGVERCWRDCCMLTAIDGTANVQRLIIGRELLGMPAFV
ncbi:MAG TPA: acyl-CoA dehydrogenase family protein [Methylomirabilota bacterium]|jgi:alkylation response protein AidB-like acyl-CoA dehydrogenase|nr:acyl-CoA dehydrogenase family protein [Methylomirabilota bacterium]